MTNQPFTPEAGLLACLIHKPELYSQISSYLYPYHFQDGRLRRAYEEFVNLTNTTKNPPDSTTWEHCLIKLGISSVDNMLLASIYQQIPVEMVIPSSIEVYAKAIVEEWQRVSLLNLATSMQAKLTPGAKVEKVRIEFEQVLFDIATNVGELSNMVNAATALEQLDEYQDKRDRGEIPLVYTGLTALDKLIGAIEGGWLVPLCGRPKMGKTAVMAYMIRYWAKNGIPSAMFQLEMMTTQIMQRLISLESGIPLMEVKERKFKEYDSVEKYRMAKEEIRKWPLFIDDKAGVTVDYIESMSRNLKLRHGIQAIIVDHLGKVVSKKKSEELYITASDTSNRLKTLAKSANLPVIVGVQLSRAIERRADKRPMASDARDSGKIEEDADLMIGLYRDIVYNPETEEPDILELISMAHRSGPMGTEKVGWDGEKTMVYNL